MIWITEVPVHLLPLSADAHQFFEALARDGRAGLMIGCRVRQVDGELHLPEPYGDFELASEHSSDPEAKEWWVLELADAGMSPQDFELS